uniref:Unkown protein n=1 Tax=Riptortus pedestris TaxID=329032 RepID=R4WDA1_RIPPE|nr:unkown protein [Riptortus pedestris]
MVFLTQILLKKKSKSRFVMVMLQSLVSGHQRTWVRERLGEKTEKVFFDPFIQMEAVYKERKKIRSMKS